MENLFQESVEYTELFNELNSVLTSHVLKAVK